jgi:hypothetical protein
LFRPARTAALPLKGVSAATLNAQISARLTIPVSGSSIVSPLDGLTYKYKMVGKSPLKRKKNPVTNVPADVIPVSLKFDDSNITFDPTKPDPS